VYELRVPPRAASFKILLFAQYLMIIARGLTRSSMSTYVRTRSVFSNASGLLTLMSQATCNSGSQTLTIGTFALETHTTLSIPCLARSSAIEHTRSISLQSVVMQISTSESEVPRLFPVEPNTLTLIDDWGQLPRRIFSSFSMNFDRRSSLSVVGCNLAYNSCMSPVNFSFSS